MARPPLTSDAEILAAITGLMADGRTPHIRAITERLGGRGSPARIAVLLDGFWRERGPALMGAPPPDTVPKRLLALWEEAKGDAQAAATAALASDRAKLEGWAASVRDQAAALDAREVALAQRTTDLERYVAEAQRAAKLATDEATIARAEATAAAARAVTAEQDRAAAEALAVSVSQARDAATAARDDALRRLDAVTQERDAARGEADSQRALVAEARNETRHVRGQLDIALARTEKLAKELEASREAVGNAERLRAATGLMLSETKAEVAELRSANDGLERLLAAANKTAETLEAQRVEAAGEAKQLRDRVELLNRDLAQVRARCGTCEALLDEKEATIRGLTKERDAAVRAKDALMASRSNGPG